MTVHGCSCGRGKPPLYAFTKKKKKKRRKKYVYSCKRDRGFNYNAQNTKKKTWSKSLCNIREE